MILPRTSHILLGCVHHIDRAIRNGKPNIMGRPPRISAEKLSAIRNEVDVSSRELDAYESHQLNQLLLNAAIEELPTCNNTIATEALKLNSDEVMSRSTLWNYKQKLKVDEVSGADVKSIARQKAFLDLRNPLSLCAVLKVIFEEVSPTNFLSSDDVSVMLNSWDKPKVITTREAKEWLASHNIGVSKTEAEQQRRMIQFNFTAAGDGDLVCSIAKIADHNFTEFKDEPAVFDVGGQFYVMLYHTSTPAEVVAKNMYLKCIQRCGQAHRDAALEKDLGGLERARVEFSQSTAQSSSSRSQQSLPRRAAAGARATSGADETAESESGETLRQKRIRLAHKFIAFFCDGAHPQVAAILNTLNDRNLKKLLNFLYGKYAGGCSLTESVNDVGRMHAILHQLFSSTAFRYEKNHVEPAGEVWKELKGLLQTHLEPASFRTFWHCLCHYKEFVGKAFTKMNVQSAFAAAGVHPFSPEIILSTCPAFCELDEEDAQYVMGSLDSLADCVRTGGLVPEAEFHRVLEGNPNCPHPEVKMTGKPLNDMCTSRQRAMIVNNPVYLSELKKRAATDGSSSSTAVPSNAAGGVGDGGAGDDNAESEQPAKRTRLPPRTLCASASCRRVKSVGEVDWSACKVGRCKKVFCGSASCVAERLAHVAQCGKK